jgi:hypothetical protein
LGEIDNEITLFKIVPNPTSETINIETSNGQIIRNVTITNSLGQVVMTFENVTTIDLSPLTKGVYFVSFETNKGIATQRIIKK